MHFEISYATFYLKGGHLDFLHLTKLEKIYITEMYMKKRYNLSITKNHKIINIYIFF